MAKPSQTLEDVGKQVAELTKQLSAMLEADGAPEPSFAADAPVAFPNDPKYLLRLQLIETCMDLAQLAHGPREWVTESAYSRINEAWVMEALLQFDFYRAVPLNGYATYADIARHTMLPESLVRRILRFAYTDHVFAENRPPHDDQVIHTAISSMMAREQLMRSAVGHILEEAGAGAKEVVRALKQFQLGKTDASEESEHAPWVLANLDGESTKGEGFWAFVANDSSHGKPKGWREKRFAEAMQGVTQSFSVGVDEVLEGYDWDVLGDATVVDVSRALLAKFRVTSTADQRLSSAALLAISVS
jgi:hypothetical protein